MQRKTGTSSSTIVSSVVVATPAATDSTDRSGVIEPRDLAQHPLDVDRLDRQRPRSRERSTSSRFERRDRDASRLREAGRPARAAVAHDDARRHVRDRPRTQPSTIAEAMLPAPIRPRTLSCCTGEMVRASAAHLARVDSQEAPTNVGYKEGERHARCGRHPVTRTRKHETNSGSGGGARRRSTRGRRRRRGRELERQRHRHTTTGTTAQAAPARRPTQRPHAGAYASGSGSAAACDFFDAATKTALTGDVRGRESGAEERDGRRQVARTRSATPPSPPRRRGSTRRSRTVR